jgi:prophage antirepressor-like protein
MELCDILGIKRTANAVTSLDEDEKQVVSLACFMSRISSSGGNPTRVIINEPGLYRLIQKRYGHMEES